MSRNEEFCHQLTFPKWKVFNVADILDFISKAIHPCTHHLFPKEPSRFDKGNRKSDGEVAQGNQLQLSDLEGLINEEPCALCANERAEHKKYLIERLRKSVVRGEFELRDSYNTKVRELPDTNVSGAIFWWAQLATIYRVDLVKFCEGEKIGVVFQSDTDESCDAELCNADLSIHADEQPVDSCVQASGTELRDSAPPEGLPSPLALDRCVDVASAEGSVSPDIPGRMPRIGSGKYAIKAAWEIECETQCKATARQVMSRLKEWADGALKGELCAVKDKNSVIWYTNVGEEKEFDQEACHKALQTWHKSRTSPETNGK